ncbi:zinc ABC transporter ATP-binding protein ZnuC [Agaribacterium haliotis]|uniref:zinc ABC transporter ATP-binding protein ZnuC n=1 Tax=Agaribacterium haliotis TaxID=2013869 RepID=UPI000BB55F1E|nr:zinc ABC transporter ATP-binding protein ZnuC [Agaribacterium haliotis]
MSQAAETLISLKQVCLSFAEQTVLDNINLSIHRNEIISIIGPNGAGKSSLIKIMAGLVPASSGTREQHGQFVLGYVPQKLSMDKSMPIKVSRFLSLSRAPKTSYHEALTIVGAEQLWSRQMHDLSGGEFQRVLFARALARKPDLLLLDEPLQGVDITGQVELYELIGKIRGQLNCGIAMVSHDLHLVMAQTDRVLCLNGHICCEGQPESVSQHPEYLSLFGQHGSQNLAVYTHHHDHHHNLHGDVERCNSSCHHD